MNIGIDIDDTITNSSDTFIAYAKNYNKKKKIKHKIDNTCLDCQKSFGWNNDNKVEFYNKYLKKVLENTEPLISAVKVIKKIRNQDNKIFFITARNTTEIENIFELTTNWLLKKGFEYDKLIVNCTDKSKICEKYFIDIFIDDNYLNCKQVAEKLKIIVLQIETRYNRNDYDDSIYKMKNWKQIFEFIQNNIGEKNEQK